MQKIVLFGEYEILVLSSHDPCLHWMCFGSCLRIVLQTRALVFSAVDMKAGPHVILSPSPLVWASNLPDYAGPDVVKLTQQLITPLQSG